MKCPLCDGTGWDEEIKMKCYYCHGTGKVEQTNEEWFCQLSTEEKAEFLDSEGIRYCECGCMECVLAEQCDGKPHKEMWVAWLKQPHEQKGD